MLLLAVMDNGLHWKTGKSWILFGKQQRMPQVAHTSIPIGKGWITSNSYRNAQLQIFGFILSYTAHLFNEYET